MVPRYGRRRPTSALVHCTMTFHTSLEDLGAIRLPYELFDQRKLVSEKPLQSSYSLHSPTALPDSVWHIHSLAGEMNQGYQMVLP